MPIAGQVYMSLLHLLYDSYDDMLYLWNWNQVGSWMAWGWTNEGFWGSLWSVLCEEGAWIVIDHNCVDYEAMCGSLNNFCQVELWSAWMCYVWTPPLHVNKLDYACEGEILKKKVFHDLKQ